MIALPDYHELGTLAVRRLNRVAADLGLIPEGTDLFVLDEFTFELKEEDIQDSDQGDLQPGPVTIYDVAVNLDEIEDWADLATKLEKLAEKLARVDARGKELTKAFGHGVADGEVKGQMQLPGFEDN